jgi:hypothetical protein
MSCWRAIPLPRWRSGSGYAPRPHTLELDRPDDATALTIVRAWFVFLSDQTRTNSRTLLEAIGGLIISPINTDRLRVIRAAAPLHECAYVAALSDAALWLNTLIVDDPRTLQRWLSEIVGAPMSSSLQVPRATNAA